ncbi:MAG: hypothetical protein KGL48_16235 [Sphingomonadales bacterium]|nr:hypothetical protein [Sphingomonadales bacterium]MDE2568065.1 hypothetical protein [Sphingomonadales bacterium]
MRGFYSIRPKAWPGRRSKQTGTGPDPYSPSSPGYAERNLQTVTRMPGGQIRTDLGEPIKRVAAHPQPVVVGSPSATSPAPAVTDEAPKAAPKVTDKAPRERGWREDYGLRRDD